MKQWIEIYHTQKRMGMVIILEWGDKRLLVLPKS